MCSKVELRQVLLAASLDRLPQSLLFVIGKEPDAGVIFEAVFHKPGRVLFRLAAADRQTVGEAQERAETITRRRRPRLLLESTLNVLGGDSIGRIFAEIGKRHSPLYLAEPTLMRARVSICPFLNSYKSLRQFRRPPTSDRS